MERQPRDDMRRNCALTSRIDIVCTPQARSKYRAEEAAVALGALQCARIGTHTWKFDRLGDRSEADAGAFVRTHHFATVARSPGEELTFDALCEFLERMRWPRCVLARYPWTAPPSQRLRSARTTPLRRRSNIAPNVTDRRPLRPGVVPTATPSPQGQRRSSGPREPRAPVVEPPRAASNAVAIPSPLPRRALRVSEVVALYGISMSLIYKQIFLGVLRSVRIGGRRLINVDTLEALIAGDEK